MKTLFISVLLAAGLHGQEASHGFEAPMTLSVLATHTHRGGPAADSARMNFRGMVRPAVKLGEHWFGYAAIQAHSPGYFYEELASFESGVRVQAIQAYLGYTRSRGNTSITVKAGQLASAFGSFPMRYDDASNWLIDAPQSYGYYYFPVTLEGMPGAEADVVLGRLDLRFQATNNWPSGRRRVGRFRRHSVWTAGGGVRIQPGFRIGVSATRGPQGDAGPVALPALGYGVDLQWGRGRWTMNAEAMRFQYSYFRNPYFFYTAGYGEVRFAVHPRLYLAARNGRRWRSAGLGNDQAVEAAVGFRPMPGQLLKAGYVALRGPRSPGARDNVFGIQYVVSLQPPAVTWVE